MNVTVYRRSTYALNFGWMLVALLRPAPAAAQSIDIYPGQNIQQVVDAYPAGTTFSLKTGEHRMQTITPRNGDRFVGEAGTVLSGARQLSEFSRSGAYWVAAGQTQEGPRPDASCRTGFPRCGFPEDFFIDGVPLRHVDSLSAVTAGTFFFDYGADRIYFADDPTNRTVEASVTARAFDGYATDVFISNLVIEKYATPVHEAAMPIGTRGTLDSSEVRLNHYAGVGTGNASVLRRTFIHRNGGFGVIGSGNDALVESNEIAYNNFAGFYPYWGSGGSKWVYTERLTVRGNFSHHNGGPGLWTDIGNIYTLYENNTVEDNERGGIFHELSYDATIRYNTARRNGTTKPIPFWATGSGIEVLDSPNVEVHGNFLEDNWQGITGLDDHRGSGRYGSLFALESERARQHHRLSHHRRRRRTHRHHRHGPLLSVHLGEQPLPEQSVCARQSERAYFIWFGERTLAEWQSYGNDTTTSLTGGGASAGSVNTARTRYLSDEARIWTDNGWGPAERDRSNGELSASDGRAMAIDGVTYDKGLGVHPYSDLRWNLGGQCSVFSAVAGIDDEAGSRGSVTFEVYVDSALRYQSGLVISSSPAQSVWVDVTGANELALIVTDGGDSDSYDHADWADAKVMCNN